MKEFIVEQAKKFKTMRDMRYDNPGSVKTKNQFLSEMYKMLMFKHREATEKVFPHLSHGQSEKLKKKSYPIKLKTYFYDIYNSLVRKRGKLVVDKTTRLPFWSPANPDIKKKSFNKKVNSCMRKNDDTVR